MDPPDRDRRMVKGYGPRVEDSRLPESKAGRAVYAETVGQDGFLLLDRLDRQKPHLLNLPKIQILQSVWNDHLERSGETVRLTDRRKKKKAASDPVGKEGSSEGVSEPEKIPGLRETGSIESPYDPEDRYCRRLGTEWTGYRVHLSETCDEEYPRIVTHVETTVANAHEARCTTTIHKTLEEKYLTPSTHLVDAAYVSADLLTESWQNWKIRLLGPPRKNPTWQAKTPGGYTHEDFRVDWENQTVTCPQGKQSSSWRTYDTSSGELIRATFRQSDCGPCPARDLCTKAKMRNLALRPRPEYEALQAVRSALTSEEGKQIYKIRAGVESSISQGVRRCGLRRARDWGLAKTHLQHVASAAALNLTRVGAWLAEIPLAKTRISRFARLVG